MKVFILEDDQLRMQWFWKEFEKDDLTWAKSCTELDKFVGPYDLILLDHDLGGRQLTEHEDNGLAFAKAIVDRIDDEAIVIVHSYNPIGAQAIVDTIPDSIAVPFGGAQFRQALKLARMFCETP